MGSPIFQDVGGIPADNLGAPGVLGFTYTPEDNITPAPATPDPDQQEINQGNVDWHQRGSGDDQTQPGSAADNIVTALNAGHSWQEIGQYLNSTQPQGGEDTLIGTHAAMQPTLTDIWGSSPGG